MKFVILGRVVREILRAVLVAPDSFKGTFTAREVAEAIAAGLEERGRAVDVCPLADGGEGTAVALAGALGGVPVTASAHDPLGREIDATFVLNGAEAFVDTAAASGLHLVDAADRDAFAASTRGTGELIAAAVAAGALTVHLGVGGSATSDGGAGAVAALRDAGGLRGARLVVLCDVQTRFEDAARVFGPQKGADPETVHRLSERLDDQTRRLARDPRGRPMTGAAGGLSGGLWAEFGAELVPGAAFVLDAVGFDSRLRAAGCVVTGEGRFDEQSLVGKLVSEVAARARRAGVRCHVVCGQRALDGRHARRMALGRIIEASTAAELRAAGRTLAEELA
jgi:glycerate kinase